ncbi:MAG: cell division protein ZapA [Candidatus Rokubacteria bacterium]|nr:cell division protein ZapA [Candidatus Rokubacteria bacterium]
MSEPRRVEFQLLGQTLTIRTAELPDYIRALAKYIDERVTALKRSGVKDPMTALALAALDITDELFKARDDSSRDESDVGKRLSALVAMLEQATPKEPA